MRIALLGALAACTPVADPAPFRLQLSIDADDPVRTESLEVEARVERQDANGGSWVTLDTRSFRPPSATDWPLWFELPSNKAVAGRYQLTATARDARASVVAQARGIAELQSSESALPMLRVYLEAACLRLTLCAPTLTCHEGACVAATSPEANRPTGARPPSERADAGELGGENRDAGIMKVAEVGASCSTNDDTSCADGIAEVPLLCQDGSWQPQPACQQNERCARDTGQCRAVAPECLDRSADEVFCDGERMLICLDRLTPRERPCDENQECVSDLQGARCSCKRGFVKDIAGCRAASECDEDYGGCDPLSGCQLVNGKVTCGSCPPGYTGQGDTGCAPLLAALTVAGGELIPGFSPTTYEYRVRVPLLQLQTTIETKGPEMTRVEVNTHAVAGGALYKTPALLLGENRFDVALVSRANVRSTYRVIVERQGAERSYIKANSPGANDLLGTIVAISGDTIVTGAAYEDSASRQINGDEGSNGANDSGAAYVYVRSGASWTRQAYLKANDADAYSYFGGALAISGDTLVVGAVRGDPFGNGTPRTGAAYVFVRKNGVWSQQARLTPSDSAPGDLFGYYMTIQGDTIVIGAPTAGGGRDSAGAAYVYTRTGDTWTQQENPLRPTPTVNGAHFGSSCMLEGDTLVVAADQELRGSGAAYVFARGADGTFTQQQRLGLEPPRDDANFGANTMVRGDTILIAAPSSMQPLVVPSGSVFVYERRADKWEMAGVLRPSVPRSDDYFGSAVGITSWGFLVGANGDNGGGRGIGADPKRADGPFSGAMYLFPRDPAGWTSPTYIKSSNSDSRDGFGFTFASTEHVLVVGAPFESSSAKGVDGNAADNGLTLSGAVYVFE